MGAAVILLALRWGLCGQPPSQRVYNIQRGWRDISPPLTGLWARPLSQRVHNIHERLEGYYSPSGSDLLWVYALKRYVA